MPAVTRDFGGPDGAYAPGVLLIVSPITRTHQAPSEKENIGLGSPNTANYVQFATRIFATAPHIMALEIQNL